jgi:aminomethyltransferase
MPLYGHEMDKTITPLETGLSFAVKFHKEDFIGKDGLLSRGEPVRKRIGLQITGRGIARENCPVYAGDTLIGYTTSGTHLPFLGFPGAMAIVSKDCDREGGITVEIRGKRVEAVEVPLPFYKNTVK